MNRIRTLEIVVGGFVALGIAALFMLAMKVSNLSTFKMENGYQLSAQFDNVGGLKPLSPVDMGGVRIGRVTKIDYDQQDYRAVVTFEIDSRFNRLPKDTTASIFTSGLLGEQYISLEPGADDVFLKEGDVISITQSALVMEQIIGKFLFSKAAGDASQ